MKVTVCVAFPIKNDKMTSFWTNVIFHYILEEYFYLCFATYSCTTQHYNIFCYQLIGMERTS